MTEPTDSPIFIVGPSRAGTTMMRLILNKHDEVWITSETHYFDDLRVRLRGSEQSRLTPRDAKLCEDYFLMLAVRPYGQRSDPDSATARVDRHELRREAQTFGEGADAYFNAYCRILASKNGRRRWGEKTPRHVFRIDEILTIWPRGKVICMVRDPRAVVSSYRFWKHADGRKGEPHRVHDAAFEADEERARRSYNPAIISLLWRSAMRASLGALERFGPERIYVQRYEDLVRAPESELSALTTWLELEYQEALLDVPILNSSFSMANRAGISTEPLERWRGNLLPSEISVVQTCCGKAMDELGYGRIAVQAPVHELASAWLRVPVAVVRALLANRDRLGKPAEYLWKRLRLAASPANSRAR